MSGDSVLPDGQQVKRLRRSRGWTQEDVARRIQDRAGPFSKRTLQNIEAGRPVHLRSIRLVAEELGTDVTRLVQDSIATPNNLLLPLTSFVGRETALGEVKELLDYHRLVTLAGAGGCGKSRLALELARELIHDYPDGVWLVELAPLATPALVPQAVAATIGVREEQRRELTDVLLGHLRHRQSLLILDNCEHLLPACIELVSTVLPACPRLRFMTTSREPMNITGETTYVVSPLQLPDAEQGARLDELESVESVQLLVERAAAVRSDFALSESNASAVIEVCRHLDGIPLALELAAARVRTMSVTDIAERLADRFQLLTGGQRATLSKHRTLRALIDWSYDHLSDDERMLLRRLSVFAGGWTLEAAEDVCAGENIERIAILDLLSRLADQSLVEVISGEVVEDTGTSRYRLLETVRQYALERLTEDMEAGAACRRHRDFFLALAEEAEPELDGPDQRVWLSRLKDEHDNLRAALRGCQADDRAGAEIGLRLAGALGLFWDVCGYWREGRAMCAELLAGTDAGTGSATRAKALRTAGKLALLLGEATEARSLLEESLAISRTLPHEEGVASALYELGGLALHHGDFAEARELYTDSLALSRDLDDQRGIANSLMNLGVATWRQGDYTSARSLLEESLVSMREMGDKRGIARAVANLGNVSHARHELAEARALYSESLAMFRELGDKLGTANALNNLGNVARKQNDCDAARSYYEDGLKIAEELADKRGRGGALQNLGNLAIMQCDYDRARVLYEEALAIHRELGHRQGVAHVLGNLAVVAGSQGNSAEARALCEESLDICRELGDKQGIAHSLGHLALVALSEGDHARTRALCEQSLTMCRELGDTAGFAERLVALGFVAMHESHAIRAIRLLAAGQAAAQRVDYSFDDSSREMFDSSVSDLRARLDAETFEREWSAGQAMDVDRATEYALDDQGPSTAS